MTHRALRVVTVLLLMALPAAPVWGSAYDGRPRLVVILIVDQLRADYLERAREQFGPGGLRLLLDRGADFLNCYYDYANTLTADGHATLLTGSYTDGHGILGNDWWDPQKKRMVAAVADDSTRLIGVPRGGPGGSPRNLLSDTLGDELKLATEGKSRVFATSLKDRAAILTAGFAADGAYWMDPASGAFVTSSFYHGELPAWVVRFNEEDRAGKYWNRQWKDASGQLLRETRRTPGATFADVVGPTPFAIEYQLEFARELVTEEKLGSRPATDLLVISISSPDLLGHSVGPDAPEVEELIRAMDRQLADFFAFLGRQIGLANLWIALSADHGVAPLPEEAQRYRLPAAHLNAGDLRRQLNAALSAQFHAAGEYVAELRWPQAFLSQEAFAPLKLSEADAERAVGEALLRLGMRGYFTKWQLAHGEVTPGDTGRRYLHSYSPHAGWYVLGVPQPFQTPGRGATHGSFYNYDAHVPLLFFGLPFRPGQYRSHAEPVDMATTLASLLGINPPAAARGRVLTEALAAERGQGAAAAGAVR